MLPLQLCLVPTHALPSRPDLGCRSRTRGPSASALGPAQGYVCKSSWAAQGVPGHKWDIGMTPRALLVRHSHWTPHCRGHRGLFGVWVSMRSGHRGELAHRRGCQPCPEITAPGYIFPCNVDPQSLCTPSVILHPLARGRRRCHAPDSPLLPKTPLPASGVRSPCPVGGSLGTLQAHPSVPPGPAGLSEQAEPAGS